MSTSQLLHVIRCGVNGREGHEGEEGEEREGESVSGHLQNKMHNWHQIYFNFGLKESLLRR